MLITVGSPNNHGYEDDLLLILVSFAQLENIPEFNMSNGELSIFD